MRNASFSRVNSKSSFSTRGKRKVRSKILNADIQQVYNELEEGVVNPHSRIDLKIELTTEPTEDREQVSIGNVSRLNVKQQLAKIKQMNRKI